MTTIGSSHLVYPLLMVILVGDGTRCPVPEVTMFNACYPTESEVENLEIRVFDLAADPRDVKHQGHGHQALSLQEQWMASSP